MKKNNHGISCYTSSIVKILNYYYIDKSEEELFFSEKLLELKCESESDGIYTDLEMMVNMSLDDCGIEIKNIPVHCRLELIALLRKFGMLLLKIDCRYLEYAEVFKNAFTEQRKHYIVVKDVIDDYIEIADTYIPSTPITIYEGKLKIPEDGFENMEFKFVDISGMKERRGLKNSIILEKMMLGYLSNIDEVYKRFLLNLDYIRLSDSDSKCKKILLYEMATALSVSGTIASRKIFYTLLKEIGTVPDALVLDMSKVASKYNTLRLLLLKAYVNLNKENLDNIIQKAQEIKEFEFVIYTKILNH